MSVRFFLLTTLFALILFDAMKLRAQDTPPKPSPPFVVDAPAVSGWKIAMTCKSAPPTPDTTSPVYAQWQKSSLAVTEVLTSKSGDRKRVIAKYAQGTQGESYRFSHFLYEHKAGNADGVVSVNSNFSGHGDFPELSWLSLDNYKDIESFDGKKCFVFKQATDTAPGREAWIDFETKLPVKFNDSLYDRIYEFPATPPIGIEPSEVIAKRAALDLPPR